MSVEGLMPRYGQAGYYALADLPQRAPLREAVISTGWSELDEIYKLYHGQFTVCTGRPGHGKSTLFFNLVCNLARNEGMHTFMYVPENERSLCDKLRKIWGEDERFDRFVREQCFVQSSLADQYLQGPRDLVWVLDQAVTAIERDHCEVVLIDPWNWIERAKPKDQLLTDYISDCLGMVKSFCASFEIIMWMIAHPTKAINEGNRTPALADIEGSMSWWNKCDNGLIVVRDSEMQACRVISAKVREEPEAGTLGARNFAVDRDTGRFRPLVGPASSFEPAPRKDQRPARRPGADAAGGYAYR